MISDGDLYTLAVFLGSVSMVLIVLYHYFEVNASDKVQEAPQQGASEKKATDRVHDPEWSKAIMSLCRQEGEDAAD
ncbi:hypothetical protein ACO1O0_006210 [Amphichorda felina]